jgi:DNA-directed RNA polymerase specialized sigma24 family protein
VEDPDPRDALSPVYADGLRLRDDGLDLAEIAERLGMEPEGVPALLHLAQEKLDREIRDEAGEGQDT